MFHFDDTCRGLVDADLDGHEDVADHGHSCHYGADILGPACNRSGPDWGPYSLPDNYFDSQGRHHVVHSDDPHNEHEEAACCSRASGLDNLCSLDNGPGGKDQAVPLHMAWNMRDDKDVDVRP